MSIFPRLLVVCLFLVAACTKNKAVEDSCKEVPLAGRLIHTPGTDKYSFRTSGGGHIEMELRHAASYRSIVISYEDYPNFKIEFWGDTTVNGLNKTAANHENLNGKHIKDRLGMRRTVLFPDGAKITLISDGPYGPLQFISIYDGAESHRINPRCNTLISSATDVALARQLDNEEADGETAGFEITSTGLDYFNLYFEDSPGSKTGSRVDLGELYRDSPNRVDDYFDDPRLGST